MKKILLVLFIATFFSGCSTIYFKNGDVSKEAELTYEQWHHSFAVGLIEISEPIDMFAKCESKNWKFVKTEQTALDRIVNLFAFWIYTPWTAEYACLK